MIEIPLTSDPEQTFSIVINSVLYDMNVKYNSRTEQWGLSISRDNVKLVDGVALVCGIDLLAQFNIGIKNLYMINLEEYNLDPNFDGLGVSSKLFVLTDEEIENVTSI